MTGFFERGSPLAILERQMQQPPGYRPRGCGICIMEEMDWKSAASYEELVNLVISSMQLEQLQKRFHRIFAYGETQMMFLHEKHKKAFYSMMDGNHQKAGGHTGKYSAAVYLLSADEKLWERSGENVLDTGIYFDRIRLGGATLEQYILFHAARDVYLGTRHIQLSELADRELIPDRLLLLIVNAFIIRKCGIAVIERED